MWSSTRPGVVLGIAALTLAACASPATSPSDAPPASATSAATESAAVGEDLSGGDPTTDVWLFQGVGFVRVDGQTGEKVGQRLLGDDGCRWDLFVGVTGADAWLVGMGIASIPESPFGFPAPESENPRSGGCVGRVPLDGGVLEIMSIAVPDGEYLAFSDGAIRDDEVWFTASHVPAAGGSIGSGNTSLYRAAAGHSEAEAVVPGVLDIAVAGDAMFVVNDPDSDGFLAAGRLDPESLEVTPVELAGVSVSSISNVEGGPDSAIFSISTREPFGRGLVVIDATSGQVTGSTFEPVGPSGSVFSYREFAALSPTIFALAEGVLIAPLGVNATARIADPCPQEGTPEDPPECRYDRMYPVPGGVWVAHVVQTANPQVQTLRRYDAATGELAQQVEMPVLELPES